MLYIIYCKPRKEQGKKLFAERLKENFDIDAIKKYTSRRKPQESVDPNLIYSYNEEDKDTFLTKHPENDYLIYYRIEENKKFFYAIKKDDITNCLNSKESQVLICQDIETVKNIYKIWRENSDKICAYCMIRKENSNDPHQETHPVDYSGLQEIAEAINKKHKGTVTAKELAPILGDKLINTSEQVDLNFFRNVSYFKNLLIIPYWPNFNTERKELCNKIDSIIEKHMEIPPIKMKIFKKIWQVVSKSLNLIFRVITLKT